MGNDYVSFALNRVATDTWSAHSASLCKGPTRPHWHIVFLFPPPCRQFYLRPTAEQLVGKLSDLELYYPLDGPIFFEACCKRPVDHVSIRREISKENLGYLFPLSEIALNSTYWTQT